MWMCLGSVSLLSFRHSDKDVIDCHNLIIKQKDERTTPKRKIRRKQGIDKMALSCGYFGIGTAHLRPSDATEVNYIWKSLKSKCFAFVSFNEDDNEEFRQKLFRYRVVENFDNEIADTDRCGYSHPTYPNPYAVKSYWFLAVISNVFTRICPNNVVFIQWKWNGKKGSTDECTRFLPRRLLLLLLVAVRYFVGKFINGHLFTGQAYLACGILLQYDTRLYFFHFYFLFLFFILHSLISNHGHEEYLTTYTSKKQLGIVHLV